MSRRHRSGREPVLSHVEPLRVRFSEVDSMRVVWHGNYLHYLEDGREAFGRRYGLSYEAIRDAGYAAPIVQLTVDYCASLRYGEEAVVEIGYIPTPAAKVMFDYALRRVHDGQLLARASTVQVFVSLETGALELNNPAFYLAWKRQCGIA